MLAIHYPEPQFRQKTEAGKEYIFDALRKKWLLLTPEEWVRQNFIRYLTAVKKYPSTMIAQEKTISLGDLKKRFDILVYDAHHRPWLMIECKAPSVPLSEATLQQLLRYHISLPSGFLVITNGDHTYGWQKKGMQLQLIAELPGWNLSE